ncbi:hypothetical protein B0T11DRAFT_283306 [Plectosphaerella cucumerina]|uniref:25S rRNA (Uridine(2843)-N(3))-methyltransferase n=1 Tax=Plectosphaerella cucumerina TaxID=40658 RepID=A0A8K0X2M1_9PEZI|nr:hypothetical protein B0T11DRAFT_283306 [Plectosphaerella cucumerina]
MVLTLSQKAAAKRVSRAIAQAKKAAARPQAQPSEEESAPASPIPITTQQRLLDVFERAFNNVLRPDGPDIDALLQEIKAALFARDFAAAFSDARPELLDAYAARWSPTRALAYAGALAGIESHLDGIIAEGADETPGSLRIVSFGGCAAEVAALAGYLLYRQDDEATPLSSSITLIDSAPWSDGVSRLHTELTTPPPLSKYASASARASNAALVSPDILSSTFVKADALTLTRDQLTTHLGLTSSPQPLLVTLLFTLNELYTSGGIGKTTALLLNLSAVLPAGSLLLVIDSPGSYSEATVGKESKRYPMHWLLDHCLLKKGSKAGEDDGEGCRWEKIESDESVWFRMHESLRYPIALENMRYQMHLYRASRPQE